MNAIDTNVLIYSMDDRDIVKRDKARALLRRLRSRKQTDVLLWQVAGELMRQLRSWQDKGELTKAEARGYLKSFRRQYRLILPTPAVLDRALDLTDRYSLSHWDSMLVGACLEAGVTTLYTEDMGAPTQYEFVQLVNPFL